ncbi:MAG: mycofactocin system FadH/OYE family oxidoreductase 1 [Acidimicrobiia bacterium]|nr:mycofactocin system FadH/OYE family oxidoreductase 1 [Acidimicrobiia bacterium]
MRLLEPVRLGGHEARNRLLFGPHETNLGWDRALSERHVAYYERRARGGAGVVVIEEASVHDSDWPYERCPLAAKCGPGWAALAGAVRPQGALLVAALGHSGGQGSSAYSQQALWAPSGVPEVNTREVPKVMEPEDIAAVLTGFEAATALAVASGCDGVEVNAGQHSLVRQFLSALTNQRGDEYGTDRLRFAREVLGAVRAAAGEALVGLRLSCDELAPWAGLTPEASAAVATELAAYVDYLVVVRGSIFSVAATRPDGHEPPGFNLELAGAIRAAVREAHGDRVAIVAQGSIVSPAQAEGALAEGRADLVEMTRAQIADPDLGAMLASGEGDRARPCILCNQRCRVRDNRNPLVSCVVEPRSGHEWEDPDTEGRAAHPRDVLVVGGGPAGLEAARVAARRGHRVTLRERQAVLGGNVAAAARASGRGPLAGAVTWLAAECAREGVHVETGVEVGAADVAAWPGPVLLATGSRAREPEAEVAAGADRRTVSEVLAGAEQAGGAWPEGPVVVWDPLGGPEGVSVAETLAATGRLVTLVSPDVVVGTQLALSGDLAPANVRLAQAGVQLVKRALLRRVGPGTVTLEDRFSGERREVEAAWVVDAGHRLPADDLWAATGERLPRVGDCVAPRTIHEAVLEGRRAALELDGVPAEAFTPNA